MTSNITHSAFFGTADHDFTLTDDMITELERITDTGIGAFYQRMIEQRFHAADLTHTIRLALIGSGMNPQQAMQLVQVYANNRPLGEVLPLALDILITRWEGADAPITGEATE